MLTTCIPQTESVTFSYLETAGTVTYVPVGEGVSLESIEYAGEVYDPAEDALESVEDVYEEARNAAFIHNISL